MAITDQTVTTWVREEMLKPELFTLSAQDIETYGQYTLAEPSLVAKPKDVPDDYIAYNPSGIWTIANIAKETKDIMYVHVEPDRSAPGTSHLGKAVARPYIVNPSKPSEPLVPFFDGPEVLGEDPFLTRINRRLPITGKLESVWLLAVVDARPVAEIANKVGSLCTKFYVGSTLSTLEHVATGPAWMKDIRIAAASPNSTEIDIWGRPQTQPHSGNITYCRVPSIEQLTAEAIANARYIHDQLLPVGSGVWGGVNDAIKIAPNKYILAAHRAHRTGADERGRHYEAVLYGHNVETNTIVELGIIATADMFPEGKVKDDDAVDLHDVVFTGGAYNGKLKYLTFGVRDGRIGIGRMQRST